MGHQEDQSEIDLILSDLDHQYRVRRSLDFSRTLVKSWEGGTQVRSNSIRQAPFFIVTQAHVPSVLVELGFLSNPSDHKKTHQLQIPMAICKKHSSSSSSI